MTFLRVVGKRLFWAAVLLVLVLCLNFFLIRLAPGDPAVTIAGEMGGASPELLASIREQYGLNQSLFNQFVAYFGKVLHGDLGYSYFFNLPVMELIQDRLPATLLLVSPPCARQSSSASASACRPGGVRTAGPAIW